MTYRGVSFDIGHCPHVRQIPAIMDSARAAFFTTPISRKFRRSLPTPSIPHFLGPNPPRIISDNAVKSKAAGVMGANAMDAPSRVGTKLGSVFIRTQLKTVFHIGKASSARINVNSRCRQNAIDNTAFRSSQANLGPVKDLVRGA